MLLLQRAWRAGAVLALGMFGLTAGGVAAGQQHVQQHGQDHHGQDHGEPVLPTPHRWASAPSGEVAPVGDLRGWRQVFLDDFVQPVPRGFFPEASGATWGAYPWPWPDTSHHGRYAPHQVVEVHGGVLTEHLRTDVGETGTRRYPLVAALTPKLPGTAEHGVRGGRFAVRFRADAVPGYKIAWLLWPDSGNKRADGEIDFPEMDLAPIGAEVPHVSAFVHPRHATGEGDQVQFDAPMQVSDWHTAVIEWTSGQVVFTLDGVEIGRVTERVPTGPMHWVLQTETALRIRSAPAPAAAGLVQVDWVAAWTADPSAAPATTPAVSQAIVKDGFEPSGAMGKRRFPNDVLFTCSPLALARVPARRPARHHGSGGVRGRRGRARIAHQHRWGCRDGSAAVGRSIGGAARAAAGAERCCGSRC